MEFLRAAADQKCCECIDQFESGPFTNRKWSLPSLGSRTNEIPVSLHSKWLTQSVVEETTCQNSNGGVNTPISGWTSTVMGIESTNSGATEIGLAFYGTGWTDRRWRCTLAMRSYGVMPERGSMGLMRNRKHCRPVLEGIGPYLPSNEQPLGVQSFTGTSRMRLPATPMTALLFRCLLGQDSSKALRNTLFALSLSNGLADAPSPSASPGSTETKLDQLAFIVRFDQAAKPGFASQPRRRRRSLRRPELNRPTTVTDH